jgi:hypothetical protein
MGPLPWLLKKAKDVQDELRWAAATNPADVLAGFGHLTALAGLAATGLSSFAGHIKREALARGLRKVIAERTDHINAVLNALRQSADRWQGNGLPVSGAEDRLPLVSKSRALNRMGEVIQRLEDLQRVFEPGYKIPLDYGDKYSPRDIEWIERLAHPRVRSFSRVAAPAGVLTAILATEASRTYRQLLLDRTLRKALEQQR